ncbi:MAG: hypothetical protein K0U98_04425 [Deltaproteobacteria bacterium]|nr:hypothetical protein [Deltaproteobacteria bacterium]
MRTLVTIRPEEIPSTNEVATKSFTVERAGLAVLGVLVGSIFLTIAATPPLVASEDPIGAANMAYNDPDQFAWHLFAAVNRPARPGSRVATWETWSEQAVVYEDPCKKPQWPGLDGPFSAHRSRLVVDLTNTIASQQLVADDFNALTGDENLQQVKLNRPFFNYVVDNDLWYQEGVIRKASTQGIDFPSGAVVYKADWKEISPEDKSRFQWRQIGRKQYNEILGLGDSSGLGKAGGQATDSDEEESPTVLLGLSSFHIVSKALDSWVWTTWNQADTLGRCDYIGCRDDFGVEPSYLPPNIEMGLPYAPTKLTPAARRILDEAGLDEVWHHYRLMGTQVTFTDHTGRPTLLGNVELEPGFGNTSSCMTCHAMATLSAVATSLSFLKSMQPFEGFVGTPDPDWYYPAHTGSPVTPIVYQTDFMWELTETSSRVGSSCEPSS